MVQTDPIADFLTRVRNAQKARHATVDIPPSKMKERLAEILKREGFISDFHVVPGKPRSVLRVTLRYNPGGEPMIQELKRVSKPGCRVYASAKELAGQPNAVKTTIVTTSKGMMTDQEAREANLGGELICSII
jgi:small subunit ribosomal protein S8